MKKVYIAYGSDKDPIGVVLAETQEKAEIFWMGAGEAVVSVEEVDPANNQIGIHGVVVLLSSTEVSSLDVSHRHSWTFREWKRGR